MAHKRSTYIGTALTDLCFVDEDSTALRLAVGGVDGRLRYVFSCVCFALHGRIVSFSASHKCLL
jgi:hypothetical protein